MIKYETGSVQNKVRSVALSMSRKAKSVVVGTDVGPVWTLKMIRLATFRYRDMIGFRRQCSKIRCPRKY